MEADNLLRSQDVTTPIESIPSQNATNLESKPKGFISRIWNWCLNNNNNGNNWLENQRRIVILAAIVRAASWFYSWLHPPSGTSSLGNNVVENKIMMVSLLTIIVVLESGILSGNKFFLWVVNLVIVCVGYFEEVSYLREIAEMSPDMSVDPTTLFLSYAWIFLGLMFSFIHTVYFIKWVVKEVLLKAITTTRNGDVQD